MNIINTPPRALAIKKLILLLTFFLFAWPSIGFVPNNVPQTPSLQPNQRVVDSLNKVAGENIESNLALALEVSEVALSKAEEIDYEIGRAESLINLGWINYRQDNYGKALEYSLMAYEKTSVLDLPELNIRSAFNIGAIYSDGSKDHKEAILYMQSAFEESRMIRDTTSMLRALNNLAYLHTTLHDYPSSLATLEEVEKINSKFMDSMTAGFAHRTRGDVHLEKGNLDSALYHFEKSYRILKNTVGKSSLASVLVRLGKLELELGHYDKAKIHIEEGIALSLENEFKDHAVTLFNEMAKLHERLENWERAYHYKTLYSAWSDSLANQVNSRNMGKLEAKFDFDQKLKEINHSAIQNERIAQEQLNQQIIKRNFFIIISLVMMATLIIIGISMIRIRRAKSMAEQANRAKSDFISVMSHEIRTPLNGVIGFTELLVNTPLNREQSQYVGLINQSATTLVQIINDILDFSKIEAGKMELEGNPVNLQSLGSSSVDLIAYQAYQRNIKLSFDYDPKIPEYVWADELRLRQILINLLSNAVKFTEQGEIELSIRLLKEETSERFLIRFAVKDTGIGISDANKERIFEAFSQEDTSTTRKFGGTGLGLAISNKILALMNSKMKVKSSPGKGSTFYYDILLETAAISAQVESPVKKDFTAESIASFEANILIAEDNPVNMLLTKKIVKKFLPKASIFEAHNGEEAVAQFASRDLDLILMDIQMPELNGYEATIKIRSLENQQASVPIIALTASALNNERERCLAAGMDECTTKPIDQKALGELILKFLPEQVKQ